MFILNMGIMQVYNKATRFVIICTSQPAEIYIHFVTTSEHNHEPRLELRKRNPGSFKFREQSLD